MNLLKELLTLGKKPVTESAKKGGLNKDALLESKVPTISSIDFAKLSIPPKVPLQLMDIVKGWKGDAGVGDVEYVKKAGRKAFLQSLEDLPSLQKTKKIVSAINNVDKIIFKVDWKDAEPRVAVGPLRRSLANKGYQLIDFNHKGVIIQHVRDVPDEDEAPKKDAAPKVDKKADAPAPKKVDAPKVDKKVEAPKKVDAPKSEKKVEVPKEEPKKEPKAKKVAESTEERLTLNKHTVFENWKQACLEVAGKRGAELVFEGDESKCKAIGDDKTLGQWIKTQGSVFSK